MSVWSPTMSSVARSVDSTLARMPQAAESSGTKVTRARAVPNAVRKS